MKKVKVIKWSTKKVIQKIANLRIETLETILKILLGRNLQKIFQ